MIASARVDYSCHHEHQELRRRVYSNGVTHYPIQCLDCGRALNNAGPNHPLRIALNGAAPPEFDEELIRLRWDERFPEMRERAAQLAAEREERDEHNRQRREFYDEYMRSKAWRDKADARLKIDEWKCRARMAGCTGRAAQVHHLSYLHLGNEPMFELISVCKACHDQLSQGDGPKSGDVGYAATG